MKEKSKTYITESWLREKYSLAHGTEIHLPINSVLTPSAHDLLTDRKIALKFIDEQGQVFVETNQVKQINGSSENILKKVHALTSDDQRHTTHCVLCQQATSKKPETLTHLNADTLISKNDPRIKFRSEMDEAIALAIFIQTELQDSWPKSFSLWLADCRSALGNIMKSEVTNIPMLAIMMGEFDDAAIHKMSHNPLKYIGYDHIVPDAKFGKTVAKLNLLRTKIRAVETTAASVFILRDFVVERPDIMQALNRLSSAVYVLMILTIVSELKEAS